MHFKEESALNLENSGTLAGRLSIKLPSVSQVSLFTAVTFLETLLRKSAVSASILILQGYSCKRSVHFKLHSPHLCGDSTKKLFFSSSISFASDFESVLKSLTPESPCPAWFVCFGELSDLCLVRPLRKARWKFLLWSKTLYDLESSRFHSSNTAFSLVPISTYRKCK